MSRAATTSDSADTARQNSAREFLGQLSEQAKLSEREQSIERQLLAATGEAYRWGRLDRRTQHFNPHARSGDAAIYESQDLMHRRTRSEAINNAQIKKIGEALTDLVVGTWMQTFADPIEPWRDLTDLSEAQFDEDLSYALESDELFDEWFLDHKQFDVAGKMAGPDFHRLALSENVQVGDALLLECMRPTGGKTGRRVPLCYQILEREQLDSSKDRAGGPSKRGSFSGDTSGWENKIVNGIELDRFGQEIAFHIYDAHPHDDFTLGGGLMKSTRIPAWRLTHLYAFQRPSQSLGVSWLHAIGQTNFDRDKFIGAEIQTAAKAALLLLVAKLGNLKATLGLEDGEEAGDTYGNQQMKLGASPFALKVGEKDSVELIESVRPNPNADNFIGILDHDTAAGAGVSYYTLTGRYDKTNFTSARGAKLDEDDHIRPIQHWFARRLAIPIRKRFNTFAAGLGLFSTITAAEFLRQERRFQRFDAMGPGREYLDPAAETEAAQGKLRSGLTTLKIECARRGLHWVKVLRQRALENRVSSLLKVVLDFSKGQGGQVGKTTSEGSQSDSQKEETNA